MNTFWTLVLFTLPSSRQVKLIRIPNLFLLQANGLPFGPQGKKEIDDCGYGSKAGYQRNLQNCDHPIFKGQDFKTPAVLSSSSTFWTLRKRKCKWYPNIFQWFCWMMCLIIWVTSLGRVCGCGSLCDPSKAREEMSHDWPGTARLCKTHIKEIHKIILEHTTGITEPQNENISLFIEFSTMTLELTHPTHPHTGTAIQDDRWHGSWRRLWGEACLRTSGLGRRLLGSGAQSARVDSAHQATFPTLWVFQLLPNQGVWRYMEIGKWIQR